MAKIKDAADQNSPATTPARSKLDMIEQLLSAKGGTSIADLMTATSWQQHSIRGAMAGALKKRGLIISSEKVDGQRRYRGQRP